VIIASRRFAMSAFEQGEVRVDIVQELRALAREGADVPALVAHLLRCLDLPEERALFPVLIYFRAAFCLSLREVLPLREWLGGRQRSEVDSILIPAMRRMKERWQGRQSGNGQAPDAVGDQGLAAATRGT
jgi:hypothetical protein